MSTPDYSLELEINDHLFLSAQIRERINDLIEDFGSALSALDVLSAVEILGKIQEIRDLAFELMSISSIAGGVDMELLEFSLGYINEIKVKISVAEELMDHFEYDGALTQANSQLIERTLDELQEYLTEQDEILTQLRLEDSVEDRELVERSIAFLQGVNFQFSSEIDALIVRWNRFMELKEKLRHIPRKRALKSSRVQVAA